MCVRWALVAVAVLTAVPSPAARGEAAAAGDPAEEASRPFLRSFHTRVSDWVLDRADQTDQYLDRLLLPAEAERSETFDRFFGDRRIDDEWRRSYITLATEVEFREGGEIDPDVKFDAVIDLPRAERHVQLVIRNVRDEDTTLVDILSRRDAEVAEADRDRAAALRFRLLDEATLAADFDAGMSFDPEPDPEFKFRGIYRVPLGSWRAAISQTLFWERSEGFGEKTQLSLLRPLGERTWFRASTAAVWSESTDGVEMGQSLVLSHELDRRQAVALKGAVQTASDPEWSWRRYLLRLRYRRMIHDDWVYLVVEPGADFPASRDYDVVPLVSLALEFRFGDTTRSAL